MKKLFTLSLLLIFCITSVHAQTSGCTDPTAANYNPLATVDDGSCDYSCYLPDSIWVSDTTENSFTVSFNEIVNADYYKIKYREVGSNSWIWVHIGSGTSSTISNLSIATTYEYKFRTTCTAGGSSSWSPTYQITTLDVMGCMDVNAINYNPTATMDDGICNFSCIKRHWARNITDHSDNYNNGGLFNSTISLKNNNFYFGLDDTEASFSILDTTLITSFNVDMRFAVASMNLDGELNWAVNPTNMSSQNQYGVRLTTVEVDEESTTFVAFTAQDLTSLTMGDVTISGISPNSDSELLLAKITPSGNVENIEYISTWCYNIHPIAFDDNNIYISGWSDGGGTINGVPHYGVLNNNLSTPNSFGGFNFLQKLDKDLNHIWTRYFPQDNGGLTNGGGIPETKNILFFNNALYLDVGTNNPNYACNFQIVWDGFNYSDTINANSANFLKFSTAGEFLEWYNTPYPPKYLFANSLLNISSDTIFKLDSDLNVIGTHIYPGLSNVQINDDKMIITVGSEMLVVDSNFTTIDTISLVGLYNDGAVYIHNDDAGLLVDTVITATGLNMAKYDIYPINPSQQPVTCSEWMDGAVSVNPTLGIPPYIYSWSTGDNTAQVDQLGMGTYSVTVTDSIGCVITDSVSVELDVAPSDSMHPQICYVTVDVNTGFNKIVLKSLESSSTSQYVIYKEGSATVYSPLDTIDANTLEYIDVNSNPAVQANRYKVSAIDVCGNASDTSDHHKTVHLTMNTGTNGEVNLIWNIYEGYQVSDYLIYRGNSGSNMNMIGTIAGNLSSFTDQAPPTGNLEYQIRALGQVCNSLPNAMMLPDTLESNIITHINLINIGISFYTQDPSCPTCNDGYIIASAYGGIAPYTYIWTNGLSGYFLGNLSAGTYTVIVFDNAGNQASESVTLGASSPVLGCTDMAATNYDASATVDDGSCTYPSVCNEYAPTGLFVDGIIHSRAVINWDNMNSTACVVDQYRIRFREVGTSSWTQKTMGGPLGSCTWGNQRIDKLLLGLTGATTYEYQMKAWYCGGGASSWTSLNNFSTADNCPNVGNLTAYGATTTKATFTWDDSNGPYEFVRLKSRIDSISEPDGSDWFQIGGAGVSYGTFTKNKNGLTPGQTYRAQARAFCDPNGGAYFSLTWSPLVYWTQPVVRVEGGTAIANLDIYPNPSRDVFNITFTSEQTQNLKVRIFNVIGEVIISEDLEQFVGEYTKQINLNENAKGIYFLEIETNGGLVNKKLILQ